MFEGPDVADRLLGTLAAAVIVIDALGLPDAYYVAETAIRKGRPVFFHPRSQARWPAPLDRPGVHIRCPLPARLARAPP